MKPIRMYSLILEDGYVRSLWATLLLTRATRFPSRIHSTEIDKFILVLKWLSSANNVSLQYWQHDIKRLLELPIELKT